MTIRLSRSRPRAGLWITCGGPSQPNDPASPRAHLLRVAWMLWFGSSLSPVLWAVACFSDRIMNGPNERNCAVSSRTAKARSNTAPAPMRW